MTLIKKAGEIPPRKRIHMCIFAPTGLGKTTLACSAPHPVLIDLDGSAYRLHMDHQVDTLESANYPQTLELLNDYDLSEYDTIIFDTFGKLLESMTDYLREVQPQYNDNGTLSGKGYTVISQWFRELCAHPALKDKHIIFVAHQDNTSRSEKPYYEPMGIGKNFAKLATELDLVGHIEMYGDERVLTFNPSEMYAGKNTCNLPARMKLPQLVDDNGMSIADNTFIATDVIMPYIRRQDEMQAQRDIFNKIIDAFTIRVKKAKTADDLNVAIDAINSIEHIGSSKLKMVSIARMVAIDRGYQLDTKSGKYVETTGAAQK